MPHLARICVYPIKSLAPVSPPQVAVLADGARKHDRDALGPTVISTATLEQAGTTKTSAAFAAPVDVSDKEAATGRRT